MTDSPGSLRAIAKEILRLYGLRVAFFLPIFVAVAAGVTTWYFTPLDLWRDDQYAKWSSMFGVGGGIIAALIVALAVEAHTPFSRGGGIAVRLAASSTGFLLGVGGLAAIIGLSPSLPGSVYPIMLGITVGAGAGGLTAVVVLGSSVAFGTLRRVDAQLLATLQELGQPVDAEELLRQRGL